VTDYDLMMLWDTTCRNVGDSTHLGGFYLSYDYRVSEEIKQCQADAAAGSRRGLRYWNEFMRLRMTT
jgi:hypothetical protein